MKASIIHDLKNTLRGDRLRAELFGQGLTHADYVILPAIMDSMGRRGISRSHKLCVQKAKERGDKFVVIMENDVMFLCEGAYKKFVEQLFHLPDDWDLHFAGIYDGKCTPISDEVARVSGRVSGLHCYAVHHSFFDRFLEADENYNIDYWLSHEDFGKAVCYCAYPMLALQHEGWSDNIKTMTTHNVGMGERYKLVGGGSIPH